MDLNAVMTDLTNRPREPMGLIAVCPEFKAIFCAERDFSGRDRRRIKREVRKALKALGPRTRSYGGIDRASAPFWRTHSYEAVE